MSTAAVIAIAANDNRGVPTMITAASGWRCHGCGKVVDETKSMFFAVRRGRSRVWHPGCK